MTAETASDLTIDSVYFAQTHVQQPDHPYFRLVGGKDTLLKVHVLSATGAAAPAVKVTIELDDESVTLDLDGPATLPTSFCSEPGKVVHSFDDCFTVTLPGRWVHMDMKIRVKAGTAETVFENLSISPPLHLKATLFDIHYFDYEDVDYPENWSEEMAVKRPVTTWNVQRLKRILFPELIIPPRAGLPAVRCTCEEDYLTKTGEPFNGKQNAALEWQRALQKAGGQTRMCVYFISIANVHSGGWAEDFGGMGSLRRFGVLHHEWGHVLDVDDLPEEPCFPYRGTMHGIGKSDFNGYHIGPTWGYDPRIGLAGAPEGKARFISPLVPEGAETQVPGEWKGGPMMGGGSPSPEPDYELKMFSDWSVRKMINYMERKIVLWDEEREAYVAWNPWVRKYANIMPDDGVSFPIERDVEVVSIIAAASAVTEEANFIYRLVGPYRSGLIRTFDPTVAEDRQRARSLIHKVGSGWDLTLRVEQGGVTKRIMLPIAWRSGDDPLDINSLQTRAVNLPVRDGEVTRAELLLTPAAEVNGMPDDPKVLFIKDFSEDAAL